MKSKNSLLTLLILISLLLSPSAQAQDKNVGRDDATRNIEAGFKQLALEEQQAKLAFDNEMRKIQLEQKRTEMGRGQPGRPDFDGGKCGMPGGSWGKRGCKSICSIIFGWLLLTSCLVIHLLTAFWVYGDILRRKTGSRVWVVITLLTGLLGTLVYAVVRAGDKSAV